MTEKKANSEKPQKSVKTITIPSAEELTSLLGEPLYTLWQKLVEMIEENYETERLWGRGGKDWDYEYKYRRGGKTLCALYAKPNALGLMIIFGKAEREKFEELRDELSKDVCDVYDRAKTHHDGKWVMFEPTDAFVFPDYLKLLAVKRRPNRKTGEEK